MITEMEQIEFLVTVKGYPTISTTYQEAVCVAGVRTDGPIPEFVRLYPVQYRDLPYTERFKKYQFVRLRVGPHSDTRPESRRPDLRTLQLGRFLDSKRNWSKRRPYVEPLLSESMCELQQRQTVDSTSLGVFRPAEVLDFVWDDDTEDWTPQKAAITNQPSLFAPTRKGLEKIPYKFRYIYRCGDASCPTHRQLIIDWELAESYRSWRARYGAGDQLLKKLRDRWLNKMCGPERDPWFFTGNMAQYHESFLILGVFWPKRV